MHNVCPKWRTPTLECVFVSCEGAEDFYFDVGSTVPPNLTDDGTKAGHVCDKNTIPASNFGVAARDAARYRLKEGSNCCGQRREGTNVFHYPTAPFKYPSDI